MEILGFWVPRVRWGLKSMWKKFYKFAKKIDNLPRNFVKPTLSHSFKSASCGQSVVKSHY